MNDSNDSWEQEALGRTARLGFTGAVVGLIAGCLIAWLASGGGAGTIIGLGLFGAVAGALLTLAGLGVLRLLRRR